MPPRPKTMPTGFGTQATLRGGPNFQVQGNMVVQPANLDFVLFNMGTNAVNNVYRRLLINAIRMQTYMKAEMRHGKHTGETYSWKVDLGMSGEPDLWVGPFPNNRVLPARLRTKPHTASAEGEFPARDSGRLASSIGVRQYKRWLTVVVGTRVPYAKFLNEGAERAHIKPRPFIEPTLDHYWSLIIRDVEDAIAASVAGRSTWAPA